MSTPDDKNKDSNKSYQFEDNFREIDCNRGVKKDKRRNKRHNTKKMIKDLRNYGYDGEYSDFIEELD